MFSRVGRFYRDNESVFLAAALTICTAALTGSFYFAWDMNSTVASLAKTQQMQVKHSAEFREKTQDSLNSLNAAVRGIYTAKMATAAQKRIWKVIDDNKAQLEAIDARVSAVEDERDAHGDY